MSRIRLQYALDDSKHIHFNLRIQLKSCAEKLKLGQVAACSVLRPLVRPELHVAAGSLAAGPIRLHLVHDRIQEAQIKRGARAILRPFRPQAVNCVLSAAYLKVQVIVGTLLGIISTWSNHADFHLQLKQIMVVIVRTKLERHISFQGSAKSKAVHSAGESEESNQDRHHKRVSLDCLDNNFIIKTHACQVHSSCGWYTQRNNYMSKS